MSYVLPIKGLRNSSQQKADFIKLPGRDGRVLFVRQDQLKGTIVDIDYFEKNIFIQKYGNHVLSKCKYEKVPPEGKRIGLILIFFLQNNQHEFDNHIVTDIDIVIR